MTKDRTEFSTRYWTRLKGGTGLAGGRRFSPPPRRYSEHEQRQHESLRTNVHRVAFDPDGECGLHLFTPAYQCPGCLNDDEMG